MQSRVLSQFWGRPVSIDAHVLLPDSYYKQPQRFYPIIYWIPGFGGTSDVRLDQELEWQRPMRRLHSEFILVVMDGMFHGGHQEFADSANNGPWGTALTTEFIPQTEEHFRAIATPQTRFVAGHSSGGWSALWLQITYPDLFGGEWSLSPDPVDFRNFTGPDLTRVPPQNFFKDPSGGAYWLDDQPLRTFVVGPGWERLQYDSFDAVFSPRGTGGRPEPLFNRRTGAIDPQVATYWEDHYDIARILRDDWPTLGPKLQGKPHIIVGTRDQFDLEPPVVLLQKELAQLGSDAEIDLVPGANHFTVFAWHGSAIWYIVSEAVERLPHDANTATAATAGQPATATP
ncbi:MAG: alpha/beta hydrolase-fold protein [Vulcanimicrobiaceae bacterium]